MRRWILVDEGLRVNRLKEAGPLEIGRHHLCDVVGRRRATGEGGNGDRQRLDLAARNIEMELGARRQRQSAQRDKDQEGEGAKQTIHERSLGSKVIVNVCHWSYFCGGSLSG